MSGWLIDTNIASEWRKPHPHPKVVAWLAGQPFASLYTSIFVIAELRRGSRRTQDIARAAALDAWIAKDVVELFESRILPIDQSTAELWLAIVKEGRAQGLTYAEPDMLIGATALRHGLTMVTRNVADFARAGVPVFNPWNA